MIDSRSDRRTVADSRAGSEADSGAGSVTDRRTVIGWLKR
jgi:hypothetical protein